MGLLIKDGVAGVNLTGLHYKIAQALLQAQELATPDDIVITSTWEGKHMPGSLHYQRRAVDIRLPKISPTQFTMALQDALGRDYDVILERDHVHIEYDPKGGSTNA